MEPQPLNADKRRGLRRGVYILPSLFTVGTLVCGYYAILSALRAGEFLTTGVGDPAQAFDNAAKALGWAIVFRQGVWRTVDAVHWQLMDGH